MKTTILACVVFLCGNTALAQHTPRKIFINPSIGFFRLTTDKASLNNSPFMIEGKIGVNIGKNGAFGLLFSNAYQAKETSGISSIQPSGGGTVWTSFGTIQHIATAFGLFYERTYAIGKKLDVYPSAYIQYLHYTDEENGHIVTDVDSSMTYKREILHNYIGRVGVNLNIRYEITPSISITARLAEMNSRIWNKYEQNIFLELPLLIGIKYLF